MPEPGDARSEVTGGAPITAQPPSTNRRSSVVSTLAATLIGLAIAFVIVLFLATRLLGYDVVRIRSASMEPAIEAGDIAVFRGRHMADVDGGTIILFRDAGSGEAVAHRVIAVREERLSLLDADGELAGQRREFYFQTKGDASPMPDAGEVDGSEYVGSLWFVVPMFGVVTPSVSAAGLAFGLAGATAVAWGVWAIADRVIRRRRRPSSDTEGRGTGSETTA
jgi:signal peptidase I